jgi:hypothetical protein
LAPFGVGKTTMMTKIGNTTVSDGKKCYKYFSRITKVIQRKHLACWSGYDLNSLSLHGGELMEMCDKMETDFSKMVVI